MQQPSWMAVALSKRIWIRILIFGQKKNFIWFFPPKLEYIFEYFFLKKKWKREKTIFTTFSENKEKQKEKIWEKMKLKNMEKTEKIIGKNVWK